VARAFGDPEEGWPPHLRAVRDQLVGRPLPPLGPPVGGRERVLSITIGPVVPDAPAILIPVPQVLALPRSEAPGAGGTASRVLGFQAGFWPRWPGSFILVDIDSDYVRHTVLPSLVAQHFPDRGPGGYRVAVLSAAGAPLLVRGMETGAISTADADIVQPFFNLRLDVLRGEAGASENVTFRARVAERGSEGPPPDGGQRVAVVLEHRAGQAGPRGEAHGQLQVSHASWRLVLRHPSGSLAAAVMEARRRNLWLGFGILAVLAAGVVLVVGNARRAKQLASNQMDFVATVSHELRTPLTVIRSAGQNLAAGVVSDPAQARKYGELIEDEGRRLTEMVEQVLEYARLRGDRPLREPRPVDVVRLLEEAERDYAAQCDATGVRLDVDVPAEGLPPVIGEESGLRRAIGNLVVNALRHAADGRWIGLAAAVESVRGRQEVVITVSDRGPGIEAGDAARVFEPFYRGRRAIDAQVHGNGLGLSLVKRVAEAHGGRATVKTAVGEGSRFAIRLPVARPAAAAEGLDPDPVDAPPAGSAT
jgi:signal transduction histidine kinase